MELSSKQLSLPAGILIDQKAEFYRVMVENGINERINMNDLFREVQISATHSKDSLSITVKNENHYRFWYNIFSGDKIISKGYATKLDTVFKHNARLTAHIQVHYIWKNEIHGNEKSAHYNPGLLNVKFVGPSNIYPGQQVDMKVKVMDVNNKPVPGTDITSYAYTTKFRDYYGPYVPSFEENLFSRYRKPLIDEIKLKYSGSLKLNWEKWGKVLGLDSIEFYRFTHPDKLYSIVESTSDSITQVAPFVIQDGQVVPVHVVYIDEIPVFFSAADQLQRYSFQVKPGRHTIRMRTIDKMIYLKPFEIVAGKKTIISILADTTNKSASVIAAPLTMTDYELSILEKYMFRIKDNFDGAKTIVEFDTSRLLLNPPPIVRPNRDLLIGPVKENYLFFKKEALKLGFFKEPGYVYTFSEGLIRQKSTTARLEFSGPKRALSYSYKERALKDEDIEAIWDDHLNDRSRTTRLFSYNIERGYSKGRFSFHLDTSLSKRLPYIKNVIIFKPGDQEFVHIYPGTTSDFPFYEPGNYRVMLLFRDNSYFTAEKIEIKPYGINHYTWKNIKIIPADKFSNSLDRSIKEVRTNNYYGRVDTKALEIFNDNYFEYGTVKGMMSGTVVGDDGLPIPGASIKVIGLSTGTTTDRAGRFSITVPVKGSLSIMFLGFETVEIKIKEGNAGKIILTSYATSLEGVVITAGGVSIKRKEQGEASTTLNSNTLTQAKAFNLAASLSGKVAGLEASTVDGGLRLVLKGNRSIDLNPKSFVIIDGVVSLGGLSALNPEDIVDVQILNAAEAMGLYGSAAANGALIITTNKGNAVLNAEGAFVTSQQTMRTNFSDAGFWQPMLVTDINGEANFKVKFPDDITSWKVHAIAMNGNKQSGLTETRIKSFKTLSANFVSPLFAIEGDSINVLGKLMSYMPFDETVHRTFKFNGKELMNNAVKFKNSYIDTVSIIAGNADSLKFEYTLKKENGYFDGEMRKIPVFEKGVTETKGFFDALGGDTTVSYTFDKALGVVKLRAEASVFPVLLDEISKVRRYEYLCNEQLASKLKALLMEKQVRAYLKQPFAYEKDILNILKLLQKNRRPEGTWGWWQNSREELWISLHIVEALLRAESQGYQINLDKRLLYSYLVSKQVDGYNFDMIYGIQLIYLLDGKNYIKDWVQKLEVQQKKNPRRLYDNLQLMRLKQLSGIKVNIDSLLSIKKKTMFGNIYWGEARAYFWDNSIQNTLIAYQILKTAGSYTQKLLRIQQYFLEQRKAGQWRNTFESAKILETILPDMLAKGMDEKPVSLTLNKTEKITVFPFERTLQPGTVNLTKAGAMPVYFTAYQQFQNPVPEKVSKDFTISTAFIQKGSVVKRLTGGSMVTLEVRVEVSADADYVMIEVPIPAGCSYENKMQNFWGVETHREYFKNKTSIFCEKLKQGSYSFKIDLMPRYGGNYNLNPAKAEMMYFPVFYGREGMKKIKIN